MPPNPRGLRRLLLSLCLLPGLAAGAVAQEDPPSSGERKGGWRLADSPSEYLREHASNPVEWFPWGEEAFQRARELDRPVFLSIGYSSCHWCHVMRRESFSDEEIAAALNASYVAIKVDREDLPHVDAIYMKAVQAITGRGGWPLSIFLTPEKVPFYGGTYFPPRGDLPGRPGFLELIEQIAEVWKTKRESIEAGGQRLTEHLSNLNKREGKATEPLAFVQAGVDQITARFDAEHGGFSPAPKFPSPRLLILLAALSRLDDRDDLRDMTLKTLRAMAAGGVFDQVGGGFHRYSVDARWAVPHFEKMLYSQGLLAEAYLEVYRMTGEEDLKEIAQRILDALLRDFALPGGGFAASWDADSGGEEGTFYMWTRDQVKQALGEKAAPLLWTYLGITEEGNFEGGATVPSRAATLEELAMRFTIPVPAIKRQIDAGLASLREEREKRVAPKRDDKIVLGWNAMAVSALARGAVILKESRYEVAARENHAFITKNLVTPDAFLRGSSHGVAANPATLADAALYLKACLDLYEATLDAAHIARALEATDMIVRDFGPGDGDGAGAFYESPPGAEVLVPRRKTHFDSALPSGNGTLARALLRLHALTGVPRHRKLADGILKESTTAIHDVAGGAPELMLAALMAASPLPEVAITGDLRNPLTRAFLEPVLRGPHPFAALAFRPPGKQGEQIAQVIPLLRNRPGVENRPTAYLCIDFVCLAPETDPAAFSKAFQAAWKPARKGGGKEEQGDPEVKEGGEETEGEEEQGGAGPEEEEGEEE